MNGAVCPYQFRHNRKIPGGWKDNENGSLGIIDTPTNSNPLILSHNLKKKTKQQPWLAWLYRTKKNEGLENSIHSLLSKGLRKWNSKNQWKGCFSWPQTAEGCGINTEAYWNGPMWQLEGNLARCNLRLRRLCALQRKDNASSVVGRKGLIRKCVSLRGWALET